MYTHTEVTFSYQYSRGSRPQRAPTSHGHRLAQVPDAHHADVLVLPKQNGTARRYRLLHRAASGCVFLAGRAEAGRDGWPGGLPASRERHRVAPGRSDCSDRCRCRQRRTPRQGHCRRACSAFYVPGVLRTTAAPTARAGYTIVKYPEFSLRYATLCRLR